MPLSIKQSLQLKEKNWGGQIIFQEFDTLSIIQDNHQYCRMTQSVNQDNENWPVNNFQSLPRVTPLVLRPLIRYQESSNAFSL